MWPKPGNEPPVDVDRAILIAVHHQTTVRTAIRSFPEWHILLVLTDMTLLGRITFAYYREFFPVMQALVSKHLHKAIQTPIIVDHTIADAPLVPLLRSLILFLGNDHLPLGKIADHHSPFSQSVCDKMGGFMQNSWIQQTPWALL